MKILLSFLLMANIALANNLVSQVQLEDGRVILTDQNGISLYTFDVDGPNQSNCHGQCLVIWPALEVPENIKVEQPFSTITTDEGIIQLTLNGKPLYYFFQDKIAKDILGEGINGVWHLVGIEYFKSVRVPE